MPQLVEYTNKENIQPTDRGTEALVQQGRRIGASFNQVAESLRDFGNRTGQNVGSAVRDAGDAAVQYQTHREISQGVGSYALLQNSMITQWNDIAKNADPHDPTVAKRFIEGTLTPGLQKWADAFQTEGGQKFALERQRALLDHMYEKTTADMGTLAGQALVESVRTLQNTLANTAANDPSSVPHLIKQAKESVDALVGSSPNLKGSDAGRARMQLTQTTQEGIVKSGAQSAIQKAKDPEAEAEKQRNLYPEYIKPDEGHTLGQNARTVIRARDYDNRAAAYYKKQEEAEASNEAVGEYITKIYNTNPKIAGDPLAQQMLDDKRLIKADRGNLMRLRDRELKPETERAISEQTFVGLLRELRAPNADSQKIMDKTWDARLADPGKPGSLTAADFDKMRREIEDRKTPEGESLARDRADFFKRYERTIDPEMNDFGTHTALGDQKIYKAMQDAKQLEAQLKAQGKDPHSLYQSSSPDFFGKQIGGYRPTLQEQADFKAQEKRDKGPAVVREPEPSGPTFWQRWFGNEPSAAPASPAIPPPESRERNHVYETPRGPLKWTGKPGAEWERP